MKIFPFILVIFMILSLLVAGCTNSQPATPPVSVEPTTSTVPATIATPSIPAQLTGTWVISKMGIQNGTAVITPAADISLTMNTDGTLTGNGGCNNYFASYTLTGATTLYGNSMTMGPVGSTKMYCTDTSQQETLYLQVLSDATAYVVDGTRLTLTSSTGNVLMYERPAAVQTTPQVPYPA